MVVAVLYLDSKKELLFAISNDSAVNVLGLLPRIPNEVCFTAHWHERMELNYVISGSMVARIGGREVLVEKGGVAIIPPCRLHWGKAGENGVVYRTIMFDVSDFFNKCGVTEKLIAPVADQNVDFLPVTDDKRITSALDQLIDEYTNGDSYSSVLIISKIYEILGLLYRCCLTEKSAGNISDEKFKIITQYISEHFTEVITLDKLSRMFGYDRSYFCRAFKAVTGLSPINYINILRLEKAKNMLTQSDIKISEISLMCGFSDPNYFSRCFKKQFFISPGEYRSSIKGKVNTPEII